MRQNQLKHYDLPGGMRKWQNVDPASGDFIVCVLSDRISLVLAVLAT